MRQQDRITVGFGPLAKHLARYAERDGTTVEELIVAVMIDYVDEQDARERSAHVLDFGTDDLHPGAGRGAHGHFPPDGQSAD